MSLVAYATSSDDESSDESVEEQTKIKNSKSDGHISDEEEFIAIETLSQRSALALPEPKQTDEIDVLPVFKQLPPPKISTESIEEEDDEFLRKKAIPLETPDSIPPTKKNTVRISIPSLKDFDDIESKKEKKSDVSKRSSLSSLISILPKPKSEQSFSKTTSTSASDKDQQLPKRTAFIPDTVKNRRPAQSTENVDKPRKSHSLKPKQAPVKLVSMSDSEDTDSEGEDFFSLNNEEKLPEVGDDEIAAMVSKKAAEIAQAPIKFLAATKTDEESVTHEEPQEDAAPNHSHQLDDGALQALVGSHAKRRKMNDIEVIDISGDQVLPNKDEWLRTALASTTSYQATGVLADEEPAAGTRRKHQITYLAHKAKANEAELQAMWAANRQNRRQTQSKYGF